MLGGGYRVFIWDTILHAFLHVEIFQDKQREEVNSVTTQA